MKKCFQLCLLFVMVFCLIPETNAFAIDVKSKIDKTNLSKGGMHFVSTKDFNKSNLSKKQLRKLKRQARKTKRMKKRMAKFQQKWEMRTAKKHLKKDKKRRRFFGGVTDDNRFRIGVLLVLASFLVGILVRIPLFGGLFGILAGLAGLVGLVLIVLALIDYLE